MARLAPDFVSLNPGYACLSSSAKADDPVIADAEKESGTIPNTGCPAFAGHDSENYCAAACLLGPGLVAWPPSSGITRVLLRFGTSPTGMTLVTFIATVSTTDTERSSESEMNSSLPSGVNVTQLAPADSGPARPAMVSLGRSTLPISLRSASEYSYTALLGMLVTHSVLLSGATPMPCDGSLTR